MVELPLGNGFREVLYDFFRNETARDGVNFEDFEAFFEKSYGTKLVTTGPPTFGFVRLSTDEEAVLFRLAHPELF